MTATGTVKASLESKLPEGSALTGVIRREMWDSLGKEYVAIVVFEVSQRLEPSVNSDADPSVKLKVLDCEIADGDNVDNLRELMQAWYRARTRLGTLDEEEVATSPTPDEQAQRALLALEAGIVDADVVDDPEYLRAQLLALVRQVIQDQDVNVGRLGRLLDTDDVTIECLLAAAQTAGVVSPVIHLDAKYDGDDGDDGDDITTRRVLVTLDALDGVLADVASRLEVVFPDAPEHDDAVEVATDDAEDLVDATP